MPKFSFPWDEYSDQPHVIADKNIKKQMYKMGRLDQFKMILVSLVVLPVAYVWRRLRFFRAKQTVDLSAFFGLCVNLNPRFDSEVLASVQALNCQHLLVRVYLHDIENLAAYVDFVKRLNCPNVTIAVLQDRRHVEDLERFKSAMTDIFKAFDGMVTRYQVGHAINRKKWGFITYDEFLRFYLVAQNLRDAQYPDLVLIGPSVIDYEYFATARVLFNQYPVVFDEVGSLLYVDRRGAPENKQFGLDFIGKIRHLKSLVNLSPKVKSRFIITETNWPIKDKGLYSPTSEKECVTLEEYTHYMVRYYLLAIMSGEVDQVFWHQLVAPGYGLVDDRESFDPYPAFDAFKTMLKYLQGATLVSHNCDANGHYTVAFENSPEASGVDVLWCTDKHSVNLARESGYTYCDVYGKPIEHDTIVIQQSPVYRLRNAK